MALVMYNHRSQHMEISDELQHVLSEEPRRRDQVFCTKYCSIQSNWNNPTQEMETLCYKNLSLRAGSLNDCLECLRGVAVVYL